MSELLKLGEEQGLFEFTENKTHIIYKTTQNKGLGAKQPWNATEEKVRAEVLTKYILEYEYPLKNIKIEVPVKRGSGDKDKNRADIIIYTDEKHKKDLVVIEVKNEKFKDIKEAKDQAISYAKYRGAEYAVGTNGKDFITIHLTSEEDRTIESLPKYGGDSPKWKYIRGGEFNDIKPMDTDKLKTLLKEIHDYLWNGGKRNPAEAFNEFSKIVFTKIMDEKVNELSSNYTEHYQFQKDRDESNDELEIRIKGLYNQHKEKDKNVFDDHLILDANEIAFLVGKLEQYNLNGTDLDIKGKIFQDFFANFFKGDAGQYFTPMNIVRFMVNLFDLKEDDLVIDPSCGSGGFLLQSLAQMQEKSKKLKDPVQRHKFWHSFAEHNLYGIEISGGISRTAKMNMIIHDDGHTNVITHDGLDRFENFQKKNTYFKENSFNYIFTNPPFGSNIKDEKPYFSTYEKFANSNVDFIDALIDSKVSSDLKNQKSEILFIERYYQFLKPAKGIVAMVLPDGILTNSSMQYVRDYIIEKFKVLASFSLPQHTFSNYGAGVKSSILVLQKKSEDEEKKFIDKQDKIRKKYVDIHKSQILAIREELKIKLAPLNQNLKLEKKKDPIDENKILQIQDKITELKEEYKLKEEIVRDKIYEAVNTDMKKIEKYPIFMAIIEEIGEDAKGKKTCDYEKTELARVSEEFKKFYNEVCIKGNINFH
ncbi:type IIB restriction/modification system, restriction/methyltransferase subunit [Aliarcobacter faecis]|uniref:N-6 DNA methylase n=1 Tax=Aliarcobacter faecis TaxID=1564138 RepID=UPI00047A5FE6|nr:N-6 DNA methylase [Aliarcobacter faecis]QKF72367.1 type IIB restriction/modification system, restriction/methyltransferase subunit [Aliarcobacter faecis]